jgi:hypothetical protein
MTEEVRGFPFVTTELHGAGFVIDYEVESVADFIAQTIKTLEEEVISRELLQQMFFWSYAAGILRDIKRYITHDGTGWTADSSIIVGHFDGEQLCRDLVDATRKMAIDHDDDVPILLFGPFSDAQLELLSAPTPPAFQPPPHE